MELAKKYLSLASALLVVFTAYFCLFHRPRHAYYLFNADFLHIAFFSESLFSDIGSLTHWYITPSPYIFPDMVVFGFLDRLTTDSQTTYVIALYLNFLFFNLALLRLQKLFLRSSHSGLVMFNVVILFLFYVSGRDSFLFIHQFALVNHLSAFICFALMLREEISTDWFLPVWLILILLFSFSDPVFAIYFLPVQLLLLARKSPKVGMLYVVLATLAGLLIFKLAYTWEMLRSTNTQTEIMWNVRASVGHFWDDILFLSHSPTFPVLAVLWLLSILYPLFFAENRWPFYYISFGAPCIVVLGGYIVGPDTFRYFTGSLFFGAFAGMSLLLGKLYPYMGTIGPRIKAYYVVPVLALGIFIYALSADVYRIPKPFHVDCTVSYARSHNTYYVITDYWNAKPLLFFTDDLKVLPVTDALFPNHHEFDTRFFDEIRDKEDIRMVAFTGNLNPDSLNRYRDYSVKAIPCFQDSLVLLNKNPLHSK